MLLTGKLKSLYNRTDKKFANLDNSLIIEFAGPMCSGKSTCAKYFQQELYNRNIKPNELIFKKYVPPLYKLFDIKAAFIALCLYTRIRPIVSIANLKRLFVLYKTLIQYNYVHYKKNKIFLKDQGIFQTLGTLSRYSKKGSKTIWTPWLIKNTNLPNLLVFIKTGYDENYRRREMRDGIPFSDNFFLESNKRLDMLIKGASIISKMRGDFKYEIILNDALHETHAKIDDIINRDII
ncbi:MAG: hypothetical protein WD491_00130 [Balneolales bacterium]